MPVEHLKKVYGKSVMAETIEALVRETNAKIVTDNNLKLAMEPKVNLPEDQAEIESVISGQSDLAYTVALEIMPAITLADFKTIKLERPVADVTRCRRHRGARTASPSRAALFSAKAEGAAVEKATR